MPGFPGATFILAALALATANGAEVNVYAAASLTDAVLIDNPDAWKSVASIASQQVRCRRLFDRFTNVMRRKSGHNPSGVCETQQQSLHDRCGIAFGNCQSACWGIRIGLRCGFASPLQGEGEGQGFSSKRREHGVSKPLTLILSPSARGEARKAAC